MPTYQHAFGKDLVDFDTRVEMCELALKDLHRVHVCHIEQELGGESRTIDTVKVLRERHPDHDYVLIVGTDILAERHKWKNWDGLMELVDLKVIGRSGYEDAAREWATEQGASENALGLNFALPMVSSTRIREILQSGESRDALVDWLILDVIDFIDKRELYGAAR